MKKPRLTAITGGIGAGKSVVARILGAMGYPVYDSDSRAKILMDNSDKIKHHLVEAFGQEVLDSQNRIDRPRLA
ncbi:MAG: dephospho-CoA kinase, partial [Muribaculaceae bacterium]|nr:dephospho-CoA kinase [Muribaculaceae bacterium]